MTPLIQQMAKITPDAHRFMWFEIGRFQYAETEFVLDGEMLTHLPFDRTALCGVFADGWQFALTLFRSGDSVAVSGVSFGCGQRYFITPFGFINQGGGVQFIQARDFQLPPRIQLMRALAIIDRFARSLSAPAEAYRATPAKTFINRARMKKGKPALDYDWHTVQVAPSAPKSEPKGGTHASPRLHDRRGHWRIRNGRKHWVRACVVGDPDKGVVEKDYHVRTAN
jgi:hypothetical protein